MAMQLIVRIVVCEFTPVHRIYCNARMPYTGNWAHVQCNLMHSIRRRELIVIKQEMAYF